MKNEQVFEMGNGKKLHRWIDVDGQAWACSEYDHGVFCRRCQPVDDTLDSLLQNVVDGLMDTRQNPATGEFQFRTTDEGDRRVRHLIENDDDAGALWRRLNDAGGAT